MESVTRDHKYMGSVKVGIKGQIVIPKEVRDMFAIQPGDTLLLLADSEKGLAIERYSVFSRIADAIFDGKAKELYPEHEEEDSLVFAQAIREVGRETDSGTNTGSSREITLKTDQGAVVKAERETASKTDREAAMKVSVKTAREAAAEAMGEKEDE